MFPLDTVGHIMIYHENFKKQFILFGWGIVGVGGGRITP